MDTKIAKICLLTTIFYKVDLEQINSIFNQFPYSIKKFEKDSIIKYMDSESNEFMLLLSGSVVGEMFNNKGKTFIVEEIKPLQTIAIATLFSKTKKIPVNIIAYEDCEILSINKTVFLEIMHQNKQIMKNVLTQISSKAQFLASKLFDTTMFNADQKLAKYILNNEKNSIFIPAKSHQEISDELGITRQSFNRSINKFILSNIIQKNNNQYEILDVKRLKQILKT